MKAFIVTDGCYSDYHICGVYSTRENAERAAKLYATDSIEEYEIDSMPDAPHGMCRYDVLMDCYGNTLRVNSISVENSSECDWIPYGDGNHVSFEMFASDETHAIKIANERRTMLLATNQWTSDWKAWKDSLQSDKQCEQ